MELVTVSRVLKKDGDDEMRRLKSEFNASEPFAQNSYGNSGQE